MPKLMWVLFFFVSACQTSGNVSGAIDAESDGGVDADGFSGQESVEEPIVDAGDAGDGDAGASDGDAGANDGDASDASDADHESIWLHTQGNGIYTAAGSRWQGRGANIHDTRSCWACAGSAPNVEEVKRRIDVLTDQWQADFIRLCLESYQQLDSWMIHGLDLLSDTEYRQDIVEIVDHVATKPGVYVLLSLWVDPSFTALGWPTAGTTEAWEMLAALFADDPHVIYGLVNEPQSNFDGAADAEVWQAMNDTVEAIRTVEAQLGTPHHLIAVQGTRAWARRLDYYLQHPITAYDGVNIIYETHVYDHADQFPGLFETPSQTLPVMIGEFGPAGGGADMSEEECDQLMGKADELQIPFLAWTFHGRCPPNLIQDYSGCGIDATLEPTSWGQLLRNHLEGGD